MRLTCVRRSPGPATAFFCNAFRLTVDNRKYGDPRVGLTKWKEYLTAFDLGHKTGVDLPSEDGGNVPDTAAYDKEYRVPGIPVPW